MPAQVVCPLLAIGSGMVGSIPTAGTTNTGSRRYVRALERMQNLEYLLTNPNQPTEGTSNGQSSTA
jgi:hypothetical protein